MLHNTQQQHITISEVWPGLKCFHHTVCLTRAEQNETIHTHSLHIKACVCAAALCIFNVEHQCQEISDLSVYSIRDWQTCDSYPTYFHVRTRPDSEPTESNPMIPWIVGCKSGLRQISLDCFCHMTQFCANWTRLLSVCKYIFPSSRRSPSQFAQTLIKRAKLYKTVASAAFMFKAPIHN